jgi:CRP/FNR family cyclic AMP-dependent transcriptional regulator
LPDWTLIAVAALTPPNPAHFDAAPAAPVSAPGTASPPSRMLGPVLQGLPLFATLGPQRTAELAQRCSLRVFERGELIVRQDARDAALFVLLSGRAVSLRTNDQGREVILCLLGDGEIIGELDLIDGRAHSSSVRCELRCLVLVMPAAAFAVQVAQHPPLAEAMLKLLTRRLRHAHGRITSLALHSAKERLLHQLHAMSVPHEGQRVIRGKVSRQMLGKMLGASREMISRMMSELAEEGRLEVRADGDTWLPP